MRSRRVRDLGHARRSNPGLVSSKGVDRCHRRGAQGLAISDPRADPTPVWSLVSGLWSLGNPGLVSGLWQTCLRRTRADSESYSYVHRALNRGAVLWFFAYEGSVRVLLCGPQTMSRLGRVRFAYNTCRSLTSRRYPSSFFVATNDSVRSLRPSSAVQRGTSKRHSVESDSLG
jgi:hypothetical protein